MRFLLAIFSGILLTLTFPNFEISILAWFAFVPLFAALDGSSPSKSFAYSYATGAIFFAGVLYWLASVTKLGYIFFILCLALFFGIFGLFAGIFFRKFKNSPFVFLLCLIIPALWALLEFLRGSIFTGFPWCLLGYSQYRHPLLIQIADITGAYGVSFLIMTGNFAAYSLLNKFLRPKFVPVIIFAVMLIASLAYGSFCLNGEKTGDEISISVVQGGIKQSEKWNPSYRVYILHRYETLTREAAKEKADLMVWPETAIPGFIDEDDILLWLKKVEAMIEMPLLSGAVTYELDGNSERFFNSAALFAEDGSVQQKYDKIHLVPFGEYIPGEAHIPFFRGSINTEIGDYTAGEEFTLFEVTSGFGKKYKYGALICFEDIFPGLARRFTEGGADFLINITNDAWFGESNEQLQHAQASVFRAVENRRSIIRAANTGLSCYINPSGVIEYSIYDNNTGSIYAKGFKTFHVLVKKGKTFYTTHGDFVIYICLIIVIGCYFIDFFKIRI